MSEEMNARKPTDPMEMWGQWYEAVSRGWSSALNGNRHGDGNKPVLPDPLSFYQTWLKSIADAQEQFKSSSANPQEFWKQWFETMTEALRQNAQVEGDPLGLTTQWLEMMEEARAKLLAGIKLPADPFTFFKQWYDATSETWSTIIENLIGTEKFMEVSSEFLKSYTSSYRTLRRANEEYFRNLQLPTRTDVARVAELVINLEDKVDQIDSALEVSEDRSARLATSESVESLHKCVEDLEQRLDQVESKLDSLLAALEKLAAREYSEPVKPAETARRTPRKSHTQAQKSGAIEA